MFENLRKRLKNAQPISTPAQYNFEQQAPDNPGSGHEAFKAHETGSGSNLLTLQRSLARIQAQLAVTSDPQLRVQLASAERNITNQMIRTSGSSTAGQVGSPVADAGFPMGTYADYFAGATDASGGLVVSPKASFEMAGTRRMEIGSRSGVPQVPNATPGGGMKQTVVPGGAHFKNVNNPTGSAFSYNLPLQKVGKQVRRKGPSFIPGKTFHPQVHTGPNGRGAMSSSQPKPGKHGGRGAIGA